MPGYGQCPYGQFPYNGGCGFAVSPFVYKVDNENKVEVKGVQNSDQAVVYKVTNDLQALISPFLQGYGAGLYGTLDYGDLIGGEIVIPANPKEVLASPQAIVYNVTVQFQSQVQEIRQG